MTSWSRSTRSSTSSWRPPPATPRWRRCWRGVSSRTTRGRAWRGVVEAGATERTIAEHAAILEALRARDPLLAEAAALVHVSTTESWFRRVLEVEDGELA